MEPELPHRVIDVGPADGTAEPRLVETNGRTGRYITLSHCWGGGSPIMTTRASLARHRAGIRLADLPRTFGDAVAVVRRLGVRHLWIDSLCIVQDDRADWAVEAVMMHRYYRAALLTLAAADADGSAGGLFRDHGGGGEHKPCPLQVGPQQQQQRQRLYALTNSMSSELKRCGFGSPSASSSFRPSRLYGRAWVFQEQVLSPRTLTYARDRAAWRCLAAVCDERAPFARPVRALVAEAAAVPARRDDPRVVDAQIARLQDEWIFAGPRRSGGRPEQQPGCAVHGGTGCFSGEDEFLIQWGNIVTAYTQRGLTYQSDKLVAIQGIADAMAPVVSKSYFAGNWVDTPRSILMSLLWSSRSSKSDRKRLDIAPSWAWASMACEVMWSGHLDHKLVSRITIRELKHSKASDKPETDTGTLTIEADAKPAVMKSGRLHAVFDQSAELLETSHVNSSSISEKPLEDTAAAIMLDEEIGDQDLVWLAEVAAGVNPVRKGAEAIQVHSLLLVRCSGKDGSFRRVGYGIWHQHRWVGEDLPEPRRLCLSIL